MKGKVLMPELEIHPANHKTAQWANKPVFITVYIYKLNEGPLPHLNPSESATIKNTFKKAMCHLDCHDINRGLPTGHHELVNLSWCHKVWLDGNIICLTQPSNPTRQLNSLQLRWWNQQGEASWTFWTQQESWRSYCSFAIAVNSPLQSMKTTCKPVLLSDNENLEVFFILSR